MKKNGFVQAVTRLVNGGRSDENWAVEYWFGEDGDWDEARHDVMDDCCDMCHDDFYIFTTLLIYPDHSTKAFWGLKQEEIIS